MRLLPQVQQMLEEMQKSVQNLVSEGVCSASDIAAAIDRARILFLLIGGEMCVCEIEAALNVRQANASHHLRVMEQAGLLKRTKKSRRAFYSAVSGELTELVGRAVEGA
ncbi:MAG: metalloregulator ArsR/SmtB family transcription factor [Candidatus Thermoplasmatota archaeon]|nr:metalloregulator ArsR/SmtB family transcription factor [Candidatus Thermoplasmatota archaeon]